MELFARDVIGLVEESGIERAHFIGHSMGGAALQRLVLDRPQMVSSLTLISSFDSVDERLRDLFDGLLQTARAGGYSAFFDRALELADTPGFLATNREAIAAARQTMLKDVSVDALEASIRACMEVELAAELGSVAVPTLAIAGEQDVFIPARYSRAIAEAVPRASMVVIAGAGHNVPVEKPQETCAEIERFLASRAG